jgi:hypothetical protein
MIDEGRLECNIFGLGIGKRLLLDLLEASTDMTILHDVAVRVFVIDRLHYRGYFVPAPFLSTPYLRHRLDIEMQALELHLLCTCIDALSGEDFVTYPEWLQVTRAAKKEKYGVNDTGINAVLSEYHDLHDADEFRKAARQVYDDIYRSRHGNRRAFLRQFDELPPAVQHLLAESYVISAPLSEEQVSWEPADSESVPRRSMTWRHTRTTWTDRPLATKIKAIAEYYYDCQRNPYTHRSNSIKPKEVIEWPEEMGVLARGSGWDPVSDVVRCDDKYRIIHFCGDPGDQETLLLRLVVAMKWLQRLGYEPIDDEFVCAFRQHQTRRDNMYRSMSELQAVDEIWRYYSGEREHPYYSLWSSLPRFPTEMLKRLRTYLNHDVYRERELDRMIGKYIGRLDGLNNEIDVFNEQHQLTYPVLDPVLRESSREPRAEEYEKLRGLVKSSDIAGTLGAIYKALDVMADQIV